MGCRMGSGEYRDGMNVCPRCGGEVILALSARSLPLLIEPRPQLGYQLTTDSPPRAMLSEQLLDHRAVCPAEVH